MEESKVNTGEMYPTSENEKQLLIDWYKDHSHVDLHDEGINTLVKICPPEQYGEDDDCEALQNILRVMYYRIIHLEKSLEDIQTTYMSVNYSPKEAYFKMGEISEQALNKSKQV